MLTLEDELKKTLREGYFLEKEFDKKIERQEIMYQKARNYASYTFLGSMILISLYPVYKVLSWIGKF